MYADRYAPKRLNRGSLGLSVAIVGSLVTAAMLSRTTIPRVFKDPGLPIWNVDPVKPPPPDPLPKLERLAPAKPTPSVEAIVKTPVAPEKPYVAPPEPGPVIDTGALQGTGTAPLVEPIKPPPIITDTALDPRYARDLQPVFPPAEQRAGRDGVVTLKVLVGVDGRVVRAEQLMATSDEFWRVTLKQALAKWRFKPATRDGVPFEAWRTMTVRFRLDEQ